MSGVTGANVITAATRFAGMHMNTVDNTSERVFSGDDIAEYLAQQTFLGRGVANIADPSYGAVAGTTDNTAAIQAALNAVGSGGVVYVPGTGSAFGISSLVSIPAGVELTGPGTIKANTNFASNAMFLMATGARLTVRTVDGTGCPVPTGAFTGGGSGLARSPVGCAVFINGANGATIPDCVIAVDTFQNFPSGPVCGFYADNLLVQCRKFSAVQTYTSNETNGVVTAFFSKNVRYQGGVIDGYHWKGFYFGGCTDSIALGCSAKNGATGHAAHYDSGGTRCQFVGCGHDGSGTGGDGYKAFQATAPMVIGYTSNASTGSGVNFDTCTDYVLMGLVCLDPANTGIYLTADTGPLLRGTIRNWAVSRTAQGTTGNHVGVKIVGVAGNAIDGLDLDAGTGDNGFYGLYAPAVTNATIANVRVGDGVTFTNSAQYDITGYFQSIDISGRIVRAAASLSGSDVFLSTQSGVAGQLLRIGNLRITGFGSTEVMTELAGTWDTVIVAGLATRNGGKALVVDSGAAIANLTLDRLVAYNPAQTNAVDLTFSTATTTKLTVGNVQLPVSGGGAKTIAITTSGGAIVQGYGVVSLTDAATIATDASTVAWPAGAATVTLGGARAMGAPTNGRVGQRLVYTIVQDGTGGRTLTWNAAFKVSWSDTGNTASKRSSIAFTYDGTTWNQDGAQTPYV